MAEDTAVAKADALVALTQQGNVRQRFEQVLGDPKKGAAFLSGIVAARNGNSALAECEPKSVIAAGLMAAALNLPVVPGLGWAALVPYKGRAAFQIMKDGFVQLGLRTGQYKAINASEVYEDELKDWNPHTGLLTLTPKKDWKQRNAGKTDEIIGYSAYFKLTNGFEKYSYWTVDEIKAHGKKYSQSYGNPKGLWQTNFKAMALKTVLKNLLAHFGPLSPEMQTAVTYDQGIKNQDGLVEYPDGREVVDTETVPPEQIATPKKLSEKKEKPKAETKPEPKSEKESASIPPVPKGWEKVTASADHECLNCADEVLEGSQGLRSPEGEWSHVEHYRNA